MTLPQDLKHTNLFICGLCYIRRDVIRIIGFIHSTWRLREAKVNREGGLTCASHSGVSEAAHEIVAIHLLWLREPSSFPGRGRPSFRDCAAAGKRQLRDPSAEEGLPIGWSLSQSQYLFMIYIFSFSIFSIYLEIE